MNTWIAECTKCAWSAPVDSLPKADQRAELHSITTGHATTVRRTV